MKNKLVIKKNEKKKGIKYKEKKLVDDNETNLICNSCKSNCHCDCECWKILFWKPTFACELIKDSKCIKCSHHKDKHERIKKYYKTYERERSISPAKKKNFRWRNIEIERKLK